MTRQTSFPFTKVPILPSIIPQFCQAAVKTRDGMPIGPRDSKKLKMSIRYTIALPKPPPTTITTARPTFATGLGDEGPGEVVPT